MKKITLALSAMLASLPSFGQVTSKNCTVNPSNFNNHVVSGQFAIMGSSDDEYNDAVMANQYGSSMYLSVLKGDVYDNRSLNNSVSVFSNYYLSNVNGRMVEGDFDGDGFINDFAMLYRVSSSQMRVDVFQSSGTSNPSFTKSTYLTLNGYNADKVTGRVVSGDFDRDGIWDDIAMFYDYGGGQTRIHVLKGTGSSFQYQGSSGWWSTYGYTAGKVTDRVVAGDFDRDGKEDDIAAFYDYGGGQTRIHVWTSNGSSFSYSGANGWWSTYGYTASKISGRVVAVNIDRDGKIFDDIAVFYDYGGGQTRMHVFESNGSSFSYSGANGWWSTYGYNANQITGKVVAIDTRSGISGGKISDILAFYDYGTSTPKYHIWRAHNPWFNPPYVTYHHHNFCGGKSLSNEEIIPISNEFNAVAYPNPTEGQFTISLKGKSNEETVTVTLYSLAGQAIKEIHTQETALQLDLSTYRAGTYLVKVQSNQGAQMLKVMKN